MQRINWELTVIVDLENVRVVCKMKLNYFPKNPSKCIISIQQNASTKLICMKGDSHRSTNGKLRNS